MSDNGSQFIAKDFEALLKSYGIKHLLTAIYSPQANASDRMNRSILSAIRAYVKSDHAAWDIEFSKIGSALRNNVHSSTNLSPYYIVFGHNMFQHASPTPRIAC